MPGVPETDAVDQPGDDPAVSRDPDDARRDARRRGLRRGILLGLVLVAVIAGFRLASSDGDGRGGDVVSLGADDAPPTLATADDRTGAALRDHGLERLDGTELRLGQLRGRPVVLNFWATFCPPCVKEMPDFERVHQQFGDEVTFVGVNEGDQTDDAADFVEETGVTYEIVLDPRGDLLAEVGGIVLPTTVLVGADGRIVASHNGEIDAGELQSLLRQHGLITSA